MQTRLFPLTPAVCARNGVPHPTPFRHRFAHNDEAIAAVQAFYDDLIYALTLELEGVHWHDNHRRSPSRPSLIGAIEDLGQLWQLDTPGCHGGPRRPN